MNKISLLITILLISFSNLSGQLEATKDTNQPKERISKRTLERKLDVFNTRYFKPFFFVEANYGVYGSFSRDETFTVSPPISVGLGYRFKPQWSIGLRAGRSIYNSDAYYYNRLEETRIQSKLSVVVFQVNAHFSVGLKGEAYGGLSLGYHDTDVRPLDDESAVKEGSTLVRPRSGLLYTGQIGIRYSLTPALSMQAELTSGLSTLSVGLRRRFR